jgi:IgGFc binding protein
MSPRAFSRSSLLVLGTLAVPAAVAGACSSSSNHAFSSASGGGSAPSGGGGSTAAGLNGGGGGIFFDSGANDGPVCLLTCSPDYHSVVDCHGNVVTQCSGMNGCDQSTLSCSNACAAAVTNKTSVGCEFYATNMDQVSADLCFAAFVANTWDTPAHIQVEFEGTMLPVANFTRIPSGSGTSLTYGDYDATAGIPAGQVAIVFLSGLLSSSVPCPAPTASPQGSVIWNTSGTGFSFHITSDVPVVSYEMNPYGGAKAATTGASLLLPVSVWDTNYIAVTAKPKDVYGPSMNIVSAYDGTMVTMLPTVAVAGGGALPAGPANAPYTFMLDKGQQAQFTQDADLTGSVIQATSPIGFMAGQPCMREPLGTNYCDHAEQMLPPVKALGNEYVGVMFRPRVTGDAATWHLVGTVNGTKLTYVPATPTGAPTTLDAGEVADFITDQPFVVTSQDKTYPFMLFTKMSSATWTQLSQPTGYGDPDFVISVPPRQYLNNYVFFTDLTYPETNLVVVRAKDANTMAFDDVTLDCLTAPLTGWQAIGDYEWTRVDLETGFNGVNGCSNGPHAMKSKGLFGLWVWGWGTPTTQTSYVSYGYPGGMNVQPINQVVIPPVAQ